MLFNATVRSDILEMVSIVKISMNAWKIRTIVPTIHSVLIQKVLLHVNVLRDTLIVLDPELWCAKISTSVTLMEQNTYVPLMQRAMTQGPDSSDTFSIVFKAAK